MATENPSHALNIDPDKPSAGLRPGSGSDDSSSQRLAGTSLPEKVSGSPNNGPATITRPKGSASSRFFRPRTGWRFGVTLYAILIAAVLLLNASFLVFAVRVFGFEDGVGTLKRGSCKDIARLSNWAHLVINALSTTMLAGSNYCMQPYLDFSFQGLALFGWFLPFTPANLLLRYYEVLLVTGYGCFLISIGMQKLCAPTRQEVDRAHSEGKWLDIGVLSLRNLNKISKGRILIWTALALSSIPVHLLYNATVFSELGVSSPNVIVANETFWQNLPTINFQNLRNASLANTYYFGALQSLRDQIDHVERLECADCKRLYGKKYLTDRSTLVAVTSTPTKFAQSLPFFIRSNAPGREAKSWLCDEDPSSCDTEMALSQKRWRISGQDIDYCMSLRVPEICQLRFSTTILGIVIICNAIKLLCMVLALWALSQPTFVTIGDAINHYLQAPDHSAKNMCTASRSTIKNGAWRSNMGPEVCDKTSHFWFMSASPIRWIVTNLLCFAGITLPLLGLKEGLEALSGFYHVGNPIRKYGFGVTNADTIFVISQGWGLMANIIVANVPQLLLSVLYVTYNGLFTCQLVTAEWTAFGTRHKPLRVTNPSAGQTSTYYLGLPYTYSVPLLIMSSLLHWLFSRSLFFVNIVFYNSRGQSFRQMSTKKTQASSTSLPVFNKTGAYDDTIPDPATAICVYSPLAIVISASLATALIIFGILHGFRRYPRGMPLAATCSASLAAACHPRPEEVPELAFGPIRWGVVSRNPESGVGHLSFSAGPVQPPTETDLYM